MHLCRHVITTLQRRPASYLSYHSLHQRKYSFVPEHSYASEKDIRDLSNFVNKCKKIFVLTGAGISTESGIRDYRSENVGLYATSTSRPIEYIDFLKNPDKRHRYWARNFAAWPTFSSFEPNVSHKVVADMETYGNLHWLVTQNVDNLHRKAGSTKITELHGTTARVGCLSCDYEVCRHTLQSMLLEINQHCNMGNTANQGPDGDVIIDKDDVEKFKMIDCPSCGGILKPKVVFFGDNVSSIVKDFLISKLKESEALLIIGSSLQVYSSFRFVIAASELKMPIAIMNIGETRGDRFSQLKISAMAGDILPKLDLSWKTDKPYQSI